MISTERAILAIVIQHPAHMETVLANCDDGFFKWSENQRIFELIKDLYAGKSLVDWETITDLLKGEISMSWFVAMQDTLSGTYPSGIEALLLEKIRLVKEDKAKKAILAEMNKELLGHTPSFDRLQVLVDKGKVIKFTREEADFQTAHDAYIDWKDLCPEWSVDYKGKQRGKEYLSCPRCSYRLVADRLRITCSGGKCLFICCLSSCRRILRASSHIANFRNCFAPL